MNRIDCPDALNWQALLEGERSEGEAEELTRHLETCSDCQQTLEILAALPRIWEDTASALGEQGRITDREPALQHVMERLKGENFSMPEVDLSFLQPADDPNLLGLLDSYQVREVIGRGGNGVVLKAFDPVLHRLVAIKVLDPLLASNGTARRRFTREAQAAAAVCHENVVAVHGVSEAGGLPFLVMQYIAGESLQGRLNRDGSLEAIDTVRIGLQTASGLAAAHAQGLIHRDIKPANLLLENGIARVKITDFGLARMSDDVGLTQNGVVAGTPEYMAPEQARGEVVGHRADLFSLGSVLYACCTGQPPFRGSTALAVLSQVSDKEPTPIRSRNPDVPAWLEAFIARLMAKDPAQRFQSASEVAQLLEGYLAHLRQPNAARIPKFASLPSPPRERAFRLSWLSALAALVIVVLAISFWSRSEIALWWTPAGEEPDQPLAREGGDERRKQDHLRVDLSAGIDKLPPSLSLYGPDADSVVKADSKGWRFTLPARRANTDIVGVQVLPRLSGDFSITLGYELLNVGEPWPEYGAGVWIRVWFNTPSFLSAMLARNNSSYHHPSEQAFSAFKIVKESDGKEKYQNAVVKTAHKSRGKLRLERIGSRLHYLMAEEGPNFRVLNSVEIGTADVQEARVYCSTSFTPTDLDVRWTELDIRADRIEDQSGRPALKPLSPTDGGAKPREHLEFDFREGIHNFPALSLEGPDTDKVAKTDERGLRVTLPAKRKDNSPVGVVLAKRLRGDFEITLGYELLALGKPVPRWGEGVAMRVWFDSPSPLSAMLTRYQLLAGQHFVALRVLTDSRGKEQYVDYAEKGASSPRGKLRLVRKGAKLLYFMKDEGQDWTQLQSVEIGTEDVTRVQLLCTTMYAPIPLDVRLTELVIDADQLPREGNSRATPAPSALRVNFHQDLRSAHLKKSLLHPIDEKVRCEAAGVRVTLPATQEVRKPSGLIANATIHGDFEITGSFEILKADRPSEGYGVGVGLYAAIDPARNHAVSLAHRLMPDGRTQFMADRMTPTGSRLAHHIKTLQSKKTAGKLRLQRVGSRIRFLVAEEGQADFVLIDDIEFSGEDIHLFKFEGNTGGARSSLDCRLLDFTLRAEKVTEPALPNNSAK